MQEFWAAHPKEKPKPKSAEEIVTYGARRTDTGEWWGRNGRYGSYGKTMYWGDKPKTYNKVGLLKSSLGQHSKSIARVPIEIVEFGVTKSYPYEGPKPKPAPQPKPKPKAFEDMSREELLDVLRRNGFGKPIWPAT